MHPKITMELTLLTYTALNLVPKRRMLLAIYSTFVTFSAFFWITQGSDQASSARNAVLLA
jgi:hypothetical protein